MKILVFSDSHGNDRNMKKALEMHINRFDICLHLGDGCRGFELLSELYSPVPFVCVNGNGEDFFGQGRISETVLDLNGYRIMMTHGHKYEVKFSTTQLEYTAIEKECDMVLYGHTHKRDDRYISRDEGKGLYVFNPGSIGQPSIGEKPSYGVIELSNKGILTSFGYII